MTHSRLAFALALAIPSLGCGAALGPSASAPEAARLVGRSPIYVFEDVSGDHVLARVPEGLEVRLVGSAQAGRLPVEIGDVLVVRGWVDSVAVERSGDGERPAALSDPLAAERVLAHYAVTPDPLHPIPAGTVLSRGERAVATARADAFAAVTGCTRDAVEVVATGDDGIVVAGEVRSGALREGCP